MIIQEIFSQETINDVLNLLDKNGIVSLNQGFFTKVFRVGDKILKVNCGDPDYGFMRYHDYFIEHPSIHSPECYQYKVINDHYLMLTDILKPFPYSFPENNGISFLRELVEEHLYDHNQDHRDIIKTYKDLDINTTEQVFGIFNFLKDFKDNDYNIDICSVNLMLKENIWILNDPFVLIKNR